jgi:hypothetical protein
VDELVLLEGHKRATAYMCGLGPQIELAALIGTSVSIEDWAGWSEEAFERAFPSEVLRSA